MTQLIRDAMTGGTVPRFQTRHSKDGSLIHLDGKVFDAALLKSMRSLEYQADPIIAAF